jgi:hypothetical protein
MIAVFTICVLGGTAEAGEREGKCDFVPRMSARSAETLAGLAPRQGSIIRNGALSGLADRGYFSGPEIRACDLNDISAYVPKPLTSASRKKGLFTKADFVYVAKDDI